MHTLEKIYSIETNHVYYFLLHTVPLNLQRMFYCSRMAYNRNIKDTSKTNQWILILPSDCYE